MTATITVQWQAPGHDVPLEAQGGILQVQPMQGWIAGDAIVNPKRQTYKVEAGQVVVTLDDDTARIWEFNHYPTGSPAFSHYKLIPPAIGAVAYTDERLTLVDPATAKPTPDELANALDTVAAGTVTAGTVEDGALILTRGDGTTVNAGTVTGDKGDKGDPGEKGEQGESAALAITGNGDGTYTIEATTEIVTPTAPGAYQIGA